MSSSGAATFASDVGCHKGSTCMCCYIRDVCTTRDRDRNSNRLARIKAQRAKDKTSATRPQVKLRTGPTICTYLIRSTILSRPPMSIRVPTTSLSFVLPVDPLDLFSLINTHCPWPNFTSGTGREAWRYSTAVTDALCPEYDASVDTLTRDQRKHLHLSRV